MPAPERPGDGEATAVRFVAYEDAGSGAGLLAGTRIAIIGPAPAHIGPDPPDSADDSAVDAWWQAIAGSAADASSLALGVWRSPGLGVATAAERIASAPARWVTTDADGTAEVTLPFGEDYLFCAVAAAAPDVIAGCGHTSGLPGSYFRDAYFVRDPVVYVYFSGGRAYFDFEDSRYLRITEGTLDPTGPADLSIVGIDRDAVQFGRSLSNTWLYPHLRAVVVADADIGRFWDVVFDPTASHTVRSTRTTYGRLAASPARIVDTGPLGAAHLQLAPGSYLICRFGTPGYPETAPAADTRAGISLCIFADIAPPPQQHGFIITPIEETTWVAHAAGQYVELLRAARARESQRVCVVAQLDDDEYNETSRRHGLQERGPDWRSQLGAHQRFMLTQLEQACAATR